MTPLHGLLVVDASRMLPGAVLARMLLELGARLIKVEEPATGDPLRGAPPTVDGVGAGFAEFLRGAQSLRLDLREPGDAARLGKLARSADVFVESFRPGSAESWGIGPGPLMAANPSLVVCRLSGFGTRGANARRVGHDLNFVASSGLLDLLPGRGVPRAQIADVNAALLACSAILAALLVRSRTGRGTVIEQPLASGALPLVAWALADTAAGGGGLTEPGAVLGGGCPAYGIYACADGRQLAVGALEPKLWIGLVRMLGLDGLDDRGLDVGPAGREAARRLQERFATRPREHWIGEAARRELPVTPVHRVADLASDPAGSDGALVEGGRPGPFFPSLGRRPRAAAPALGQHDVELAREFSLDEPGPVG
jgi:crotonobetainyl-CoA:carnitine CoA-transferase CaiB-like acyl-CoA transferase